MRLKPKPFQYEIKPFKKTQSTKTNFIKGDYKNTTDNDK